MMDEELTRKCTTCGHVGPFDDFIRSERYKYGIRPTCKRCISYLNSASRGNTAAREYKFKHRTREEKLTDAIKILIDNGYALTEEDAKNYIGVK